MVLLTYNPQRAEPWNKGKLIGQKPPLKVWEIRAIQVRESGPAGTEGSGGR